MQLVEQIKVHVRYKDHLRIRGCLRTLAIGRESEIARREHTRLGVLYIHIMHTRQVAHAARYHHEALILDRPGLSTHTNPRVTVLRIRKERHEEDLHPLVGHDTGKLREFHVITDQHADPGAIRVKRLHHLPARESPALLLVRGDMYLLVHLVGAVTTDQVSHVI